MYFQCMSFLLYILYIWCQCGQNLVCLQWTKLVNPLEQKQKFLWMNMQLFEKKCHARIWNQNLCSRVKNTCTERTLIFLVEFSDYLIVNYNCQQKYSLILIDMVSVVLVKSRNIIVSFSKRLQLQHWEISNVDKHIIFLCTFTFFKFRFFYHFWD